MAQNKRREPRQSIMIPCWLMLAEGDPPVEGWLRDVSKSGARVVTETSELQLPEQFTLALTADLKVCRHCELAWRTGNQFGVRFTHPAAKEPGSKLQPA